MFIGLCSWMRPNVRIYGTPNFTRLLWMWSLQLGFLPCLLTLSLTFLSIPAIRLIADLAAEKKKNSYIGLNGTDSNLHLFYPAEFRVQSDQNYYTVSWNLTTKKKNLVIFIFRERSEQNVVLTDCSQNGLIWILTPKIFFFKLKIHYFNINCWIFE